MKVELTEKVKKENFFSDPAGRGWWANLAVKDSSGEIKDFIVTSYSKNLESLYEKVLGWAVDHNYSQFYQKLCSNQT